MSEVLLSGSRSQDVTGASRRRGVRTRVSRVADRAGVAVVALAYAPRRPAASPPRRSCRMANRRTSGAADRPRPIAPSTRPNAAGATERSSLLTSLDDEDCGVAGATAATSHASSRRRVVLGRDDWARYASAREVRISQVRQPLRRSTTAGGSAGKYRITSRSVFGAANAHRPLLGRCGGPRSGPRSGRSAALRAQAESGDCSEGAAQPGSVVGQKRARASCSV